jgi:hypothetical protein
MGILGFLIFRNRRNAPPGIFVISTDYLGAWLNTQGGTSQCPSGHFCYFYMVSSGGLGNLAGSSSRNAPPGIFVISTCNLHDPRRRPQLVRSQCPSGHFCYFYLELANDEPMTYKHESQCPSGHFCYFYRSRTRTWSSRSCSRRNAPPGIFVISTCGARQAFVPFPPRSQCPSGHFCYFYRFRD